MKESFAFLQNIGVPGLILIFVVVLLLFGAKKLPELAKGLGKSMVEFKKATREVEDSFREASDNIDEAASKKPKSKIETKVEEEDADFENKSDKSE